MGKWCTPTKAAFSVLELGKSLWWNWENTLFGIYNNGMEGIRWNASSLIDFRKHIDYLWVPTIFAEESQTKNAAINFYILGRRKKKDTLAKILVFTSHYFHFFMVCKLVNFVLCWMIYGLKGIENISWASAFSTYVWTCIIFKYLGILLGLAFSGAAFIVMHHYTMFLHIRIALLCSNYCGCMLGLWYW